MYILLLVYLLNMDFLRLKTLVYNFKILNFSQKSNKSFFKYSQNSYLYTILTRVSKVNPLHIHKQIYIYDIPVVYSSC